MKSKLGPHILAPTKGGEDLVRAKPVVVKLVDDMGLAQLAVDMGSLVVGRSTGPSAESFFFDGKSPVIAAQEWVSRQRATYKANPLIFVWEGPNEPVWENEDQFRWYAAFEAERVIALSAMGLRAVVGNFSMGSPGDLAWWDLFFPAISAANLLGGYLGLHEYSSPFMWWAWNGYQVVPGETSGDTGWLTLRYRKVVERLRAAGVSTPKILITECGLDTHPHVRPGMLSGRWRDLTSFWESWDGGDDPPDVSYWRNGGRDVERYYAEQLIWYDRQLQQDDYVIGATVFTVGRNNEAWQPHDIAGTRIVDRLVEHIVSSDNVPIPPDNPNMPPTLPPGLVFLDEFKSGHYLPDLARDNRRVPNGWVYSDLDASAPMIDRQDDGWTPAETEIKGADSLHVSDLPTILENDPTREPFHISKGNGRIWGTLLRRFGFAPGKYRAVFRVWPDILIDQFQTAEGLVKIPAPDPLNGEIEIMYSPQRDATKFVTSGWRNKHDYSYAQYSDVVLEFDHIGGDFDIVLNLRCRWGVKVVGWFIANFKLFLLETPPAPPPVEVGISKAVVAGWMSRLDLIFDDQAEQMALLNDLIDEMRSALE